MTDDATPEATAPAPAAASGLKAKATDLGTQAFMKAPPKAQNAILLGIGAVQPVAKVVTPHAKKLAVGAVSLLALRKLRHRGE
jgi:hypothetical protein